MKWVEWTYERGAVPPLVDGTRVMVRLRDGREHRYGVGSGAWNGALHDRDIIAYAVIEEVPAEPAEAIKLKEAARQAQQLLAELVRPTDENASALHFFARSVEAEFALRKALEEAP